MTMDMDKIMEQFQTNITKITQFITLSFLLVFITYAFAFGQGHSTKDRSDDMISSEWAKWYRPADQPVFNTKHGNNHDAILFVDRNSKYPYKMIVSHEKTAAQFWRTKEFSWNSVDWELVTNKYKIANYYEYDDGIKVNGKYYIFESGNVYTYSGSLKKANGNWKKSGSFPNKTDDIGIYYEDGVFHLFGEYGNYPPGPDGTSLVHYISETGLGDWKMVDEKAVNPNPDGGNTYGVGDATIAKIEGEYYVFCDLESEGMPYRIVAWKSSNINKPFENLGEVIKPRSNKVDDWDNHRVQDGDIAYIPQLSRYVMVANMKDIDGNPGDPESHFNSTHLEEDETRVVGFFYSKKRLIEKDNK